MAEVLAERGLGALENHFFGAALLKKLESDPDGETALGNDNVELELDGTVSRGTG